MNQQPILVALKEKEAPLNMGNTTITDQKLFQRVLARAIKDASFRQALVSDPRQALTREFNFPLAETVTIRVLEDAPDTFTLVLPPQEVSFQELSDADLEEAISAQICDTGSYPTQY